ncbi:MAG: hypothetical protein J5493_05155 [Lachnospiraceae bacterium]|nr:hypothetical protein [Lachnospiraceae bacterium]
MYCVKCGVQLEDGLTACPLCSTPVWNPEPAKRNIHYNPDLYPKQDVRGKFTILSLVTLIFAAISLGCLIACLNYYGRADWSAYVAFSALFLYVTAVLPAWFPRYYPVIFIPVTFAALEGFLLFLCLYTGGHWFLSLAFPVVGMVFLFTYAAFWLARAGILPRLKLRLLGIWFILLGAATMLIELFIHITFPLPMFNWSLYTAGVFAVFGLFLFIASFIKPLRRALYKKTFV